MEEAQPPPQQQEAVQVIKAEQDALKEFGEVFEATNNMYQAVLRLMSAQNCIPSAAATSNGQKAKANKTGNGEPKFRGVTQHRRTQKWEAHIWDDRHQLYLGGYESKDNAGKAHDLLAMKTRGDNTVLNYMEETYQFIRPMLPGVQKEILVEILRLFSRGANGNPASLANVVAICMSNNDLDAASAITALLPPALQPPPPQPPARAPSLPNSNLSAQPSSKAAIASNPPYLQTSRTVYKHPWALPGPSLPPLDTSQRPSGGRSFSFGMPAGSAQPERLLSGQCQTHESNPDDATDYTSAPLSGAVSHPKPKLVIARSASAGTATGQKSTLQVGGSDPNASKGQGRKRRRQSPDWAHASDGDEDEEQAPNRGLGADITNCLPLPGRITSSTQQEQQQAPAPQPPPPEAVRRTMTKKPRRSSSGPQGSGAEGGAFMSRQPPGQAAGAGSGVQPDALRPRSFTPVPHNSSCPAGQLPRPTAAAVGGSHADTELKRHQPACSRLDALGTGAGPVGADADAHRDHMVAAAFDVLEQQQHYQHQLQQQAYMWGRSYSMFAPLPGYQPIFGPQAVEHHHHLGHAHFQFSQPPVLSLVPPNPNPALPQQQACFPYPPTAGVFAAPALASAPSFAPPAAGGIPGTYMPWSSPVFCPHQPGLHSVPCAVRRRSPLVGPLSLASCGTRPRALGTPTAVTTAELHKLTAAGASPLGAAARAAAKDAAGYTGCSFDQLLDQLLTSPHHNLTGHYTPLGASLGGGGGSDGAWHKIQGSLGGGGSMTPRHAHGAGDTKRAADVGMQQQQQVKMSAQVQDQPLSTGAVGDEQEDLTTETASLVSSGSTTDDEAVPVARPTMPVPLPSSAHTLAASACPSPVKIKPGPLYAGSGKAGLLHVQHVRAGGVKAAGTGGGLHQDDDVVLASPEVPGTAQQQQQADVLMREQVRMSNPNSTSSAGSGHCQVQVVVRGQPALSLPMALPSIFCHSQQQAGHDGPPGHGKLIEPATASVHLALQQLQELATLQQSEQSNLPHTHAMPAACKQQPVTRQVTSAPAVQQPASGMGKAPPAAAVGPAPPVAGGKLSGSTGPGEPAAAGSTQQLTVQIASLRRSLFD